VTSSPPSSAEPQHSPEPPARAPLFIVGSARTGSTLLRHVLNRAPDVCLASETHFMRWARRIHLEAHLRRVHDAGAPEHELRRLAELFFRSDFWPWLRRNVDRDEFARRLSATDLSLASVFGLLIELYAERNCNGANGDVVSGEKTPEHLDAVPAFAAWFPGARVIHTFRDPRAIYASQLRRSREGRWGPKARLPWLPAVAVNWLLAPLEAVTTALAWRKASRLHARYAELLGACYRLERFEDLVADPQREVRAICEFIGVSFRPEMLEGTDVVGSSFEHQRHSSQGFDSTVVTRWRQEVHPLARRWFSIVLRRQLAAFGYDR
jgi:hypothetical protein